MGVYVQDFFQDSWQGFAYEAVTYLLNMRCSLSLPLFALLNHFKHRESEWAGYLNQPSPFFAGNWMGKFGEEWWGRVFTCLWLFVDASLVHARFPKSRSTRQPYCRDFLPFGIYFKDGSVVIIPIFPYLFPVKMLQQRIGIPSKLPLRNR